MSELEPPEFPIETGKSINNANINNEISQSNQFSQQNTDENKKSFFKKLFSKKSKKKDSLNNVAVDQVAEAIHELPNFDFNIPSMPEISDDTALSGLPELPTMKTLPEISSKNKTKITGKGKGKGEKLNFSKTYETINLVDELHWDKSINEQKPLIEDSNRQNQDIINLISKAKQQVSEQNNLTKNNVFMSSAPEEPILLNNKYSELPETPALDFNMNQEEKQQEAEKITDEKQFSLELVNNNAVFDTMPSVNPEISTHFKKLEKQHQKLKDQLNKKINNPKFSINKQEAIQLMKEYDEKIEEKIENKENELDIKFKKLQELHKNLNKKDSAIAKMQSYLSKTDRLLKEKESKINSVITEKVLSTLNKKLKKEKAFLKKEISKTIKLNKELEKKLVIIEKDRKSFDKKRDVLLDKEQNKLNSMQTMYEKKLAELTQEKKAFEARMKSAIPLVERGEEIQQELEKINMIKKAVETDKIKVRRELNIDRKMKDSIIRSENQLKKEKESLEKQMFDKYIESRLKEIRPSGLKTEEIIENMNYKLPEIYSLIDSCRENIEIENIAEAKKTYNKIKHIFEKTKFENRERAILYNTIREIYNEIQLKIIELQNHNI